MGNNFVFSDFDVNLSIARINAHYMFLLLWKLKILPINSLSEGHDGDYCYSERRNYCARMCKKKLFGITRQGEE